MTEEKERELFETVIFAERFIRGVKKVDNGQYPFRVDCPTKAELFERRPNGHYTDKHISAMWFSWKLRAQQTDESRS